MRAHRVLVVVLTSLALSDACALGVDLANKRCDPSHACANGFVCSHDRCVVAGAEGEEGEGEGVGGEGEGVSTGEGEGVSAGEGEGVSAGEGEGEGTSAGEGEGEGAPPCTGDFFVNDDGDTLDAAIDGVCADANGACTLRAALMELAANGSGGGVICYDPTGSLATILTSSIAIDTTQVTIDGGPTGVVISGAGSDRLFSLTNGARLVVERATLTGGRINTDAAAVEVHSGSTLRLEDSIVKDNICTEDATDPTFYEGGAISAFDDSHVEIVRTLLQANRLDTNDNQGRGGAVGMHSPSSLLVQDSIFDSNHAQSVGGAIFLATLGANITIERTTFVGNNTDSRGGAVDVNCGTSGTVSFVNDTFFGNQANEIVFVCGHEDVEFHHVTFSGNTGALTRLDDEDPSSGPGTVVFEGSIVDAPAASTCVINTAGTYTSLGGNVATTTDSVCPFSASNGDALADPQLDASGLANNGGAATTLAISSTSPARGAASNQSCPVDDERGYLRIDGACDAGAYEFGATP